MTNPIDAPPAPQAVPRLHVPDEPVSRREVWRAAALDGVAFDEVLTGDDGVSAWLWPRWSVLAGSGIDRPVFDRIVLGYRRELWLWLLGDRIWDQCCAGLIGRISRRIPA